jgi:hypothetical protein
VLQFRFPFEFRRRDAHFVAYILEKLGANRSFGASGRGREVRYDDGVLLAGMLKHNAQICSVHEVLQVGTAGRRQEINQGVSRKSSVQLEELDSGSPKVRLSLFRRQIRHRG